MLGWGGEQGHVCTGTRVRVRATRSRAPGRRYKQAQALLGDACLRYPVPICCWLKACASVHVRSGAASVRTWGARHCQGQGTSPRGLPTALSLCLEDASIQLLGNKPIFEASPVASVSTYVSCWDTGSINEQHRWQLAEHNAPALGSLAPWWHLALSLVGNHNGLEGWSPELLPR